MTGTGGSGAAGGADRPEPRLRQHPGRERACGDAPKPKKSAPAASPEGASPSPEASYAPEAAPEPAPEPTPEPAAKKPAEAPAEAEPETGPVKHVFVISLTSPGYEQSLGAQSQMPYLSATLRPQGELLGKLRAARRRRAAQRHRRDQWPAAPTPQPPPAARATKSSARSRRTRTGSSPAPVCVYPVETLTLADQLTLDKLNWRAYADGMVDPEGKPADCVHPGPGEGSGLGSAGRLRGEPEIRSSTSTRCSTSAIARPATCRSIS